MKLLWPGVIEHYSLKSTSQKFLCTYIYIYIYIYTTELSHNAGVALGKQVSAVWIETLQKNQPKPQQFVSPQGLSGGAQEIQ